MKEDNQAVIKALNMYGRVPKLWELLEEIERLNNGLKDIKWYIEKNKTSFSDLYIPASDVVSILVIIDRLLGADKE